MPDVSVFGDIYNLISEGTVSLEAYLDEVQCGKWEDVVHTIRKQKTDAAKDKLKQKMPRITFSGQFSQRINDGLIEHSGFLAADLDDLEDPEIVKEVLKADKYIHSVFRSAGGKGLTILFKINPKKHRESYYGIANYLFLNYGQITDPGSVAPSKPFCYTFDPHIYRAEFNVSIFNQYPKERKIEKISNFAFAEDDFTALLNQIVARNIDLTQDYNEWVKIGFAFVDKFGENGRQYYHMISGVNSKYNVKKTDEQYKYCLRSHNTLKLATIATFYYYAREAGLQITSQRTAKIRKATLNGKAAGLKKEQILKNLKDFEGIDDCEVVVSEVFDGVAQIGDGESMIEQLELFISSNYNIRRNELTRYLERDGKDMTQRDINSIFVAAKKFIDKLQYDLVERLLISDFIKQYNPLVEFFERLPEVKTHPEGWFEKHNYREDDNRFYSPLIDKMASSIKNDIPEFTNYFLRKWLVGIVSAAHGDHSPLIFVLVGQNQGKGKTEFLRRFFPRGIYRYYGESKLDAGKDDEILMTQKLVIMDDEFGGKSKKESEKMKNLTSKQYFSLREPYGRANVDLLRLAVLCGTSNYREVLHDPTGNRRIIPVPVDDVDKDLYNSINKEDLFTEMYSLWRSGFDWRVINKEDIDYLRKYETDYEALNLERELILKFFKPGNKNSMSSSEIKVFLEMKTNQKLSLDQVGRQLTKLRFVKKSVRIDTVSSVKKWLVERCDNDIPPSQTGGFVPMTIDDF